LNLEELSKQFRRLPGVGPRTAEKMAYYWLTLEDDEAERFSYIGKFQAPDNVVQRGVITWLWGAIFATSVRITEGTKPL